MKKIDKKIIKYANSYIAVPGYIKRKALKAEFSLDDKKLDIIISRLTENGYLEENKTTTTHNGITYVLTDEGKNYYKYITRSIWEVIKDHPVRVILSAFLLYIFDYLLNLFSVEIKCILVNLF